MIMITYLEEYIKRGFKVGDIINVQEFNHKTNEIDEIIEIIGDTETHYFNITAKGYSTYNARECEYDYQRHEIKEIRLATFQEIEHLSQCIDAKRYVEYTLTKADSNIIKNRLKQLKF